MSAVLRRGLAATLAVALSITAPVACTVAGGGVAYDGSVGIGLDYYEPFGYDYGGWGSGYGIGPYRDGGHQPEFRGGNPRGHAWRSTPISRGMPSVPSQPRGGGGRPGGGRHR